MLRMLLNADVLNFWLHLTAAAVWVGGSVFFSLILQPAFRTALPPSARMALYSDVGRRFKWVQVGCIIVVILTGIYPLRSFFFAPSVLHSSYGAILGVKVLCVAVVATTGLLHSFLWAPQMVKLSRKPEDPRFKRILRLGAWSGKINLGLMGVILLLSAFLRINPF